jgi:hypothetical protein
MKLWYCKLVGGGWGQLLQSLSGSLDREGLPGGLTDRSERRALVITIGLPFVSSAYLKPTATARGLLFRRRESCDCDTDCVSPLIDRLIDNELVGGDVANSASAGATLLLEGKLNPPGKNPSSQQDACQGKIKTVRNTMIEFGRTNRGPGFSVEKTHDKHAKTHRGVTIRKGRKEEIPVGCDDPFPRCVRRDLAEAVDTRVSRVKLFFLEKFVLFGDRHRIFRESLILIFVLPLV